MPVQIDPQTGERIAAPPPTAAPQIDPQTGERINAPTQGAQATTQPKGFGDWLEDLGNLMRPVSVPGKLGGTMQADMTRPPTGGAKAVSSGIAGMLDFVHWLSRKYTGIDMTAKGDPTVEAFTSQYLKEHPTATHDEIAQAFQKMGQEKVADHFHDITDYLRRGTEPKGPGEMLGYGTVLAAEGELMPELDAGALLRIAGKPGARAAEAFGSSKKLAEALAENPTAQKYLAIGIKASKAAAEQAAIQGGQTYLHTEDPEEARKAAVLAGGLGLVSGAGEVGAQAWRDKFGTKTLQLAHGEVPALARQVNEEGYALPGRAEEAPKVQAAQEAAFPKEIAHVARTAARNAFEDLNQTRPVLQPITDESRLLPAPENATLPTFTIEGTPAFETQAGTLMQPAERIPASATTTPASYGGQAHQSGFLGTAPPPEGGRQPAFQTSGERVPGYMHPVPEITGPTPEEVVFGGETPRPQPAKPGREDVVKGGGPMSTNSVQEAESWLHRYDEVQASPAYDDMPEARRNEIESQRKSLEDQLNMHYASQQGHPATTQRFLPVDADKAVNFIHTFGDASAQIEAAAKPVYQRLDQLSDGEFNKLRQQAKAAKQTMRRAGSIDAYEAAERRYHEANQGIADLIDRSSPHITQQDYQAARNAWRQSRRLDELDTVFERMMNGVTHSEGEIGMPRFIDKARTKAIQNYLDTGTNRKQIVDLIGSEGIINLKNVTNLLSDRATSQQAQMLMQDSAKLMRDYLRHGSVGAAVGAGAAHFLGISPLTGAATGAATADGLRWMWRYAATTPQVGQMIDMAVRNGVSSKIAAPLIARAIAQAAGLYQPGKEQSETKP